MNIVNVPFSHSIDTDRYGTVHVTVFSRPEHYHGLHRYEDVEDTLPRKYDYIMDDDEHVLIVRYADGVVTVDVEVTYAEAYPFSRQGHRRWAVILDGNLPNRRGYYTDLC